jgi:hypothetical protein
MAAVMALGKGRRVEDICAETGLQVTAALKMAGTLLTSPQRFLLEPGLLQNVDAATDLALMWAALLDGYGRAPHDLFGDRRDIADVIGSLQDHHNPNVSEYAIWSLSNNPRYSLTDLRIPPIGHPSAPPNAQRWINRLVTKESDLPATRVDLVDDLRRDRATVAREGLALGLRYSFTAAVTAVVEQWFSQETDDGTRRALLEHMARYSNHSGNYTDHVRDSFKKERTETVRKRIISAAARTTLYSELKRIEAKEQIGEQPELFSVFQQLGGLINVTNDHRTYNITNLNARAVAFGDMCNSANQTVSQLPAAREDERMLLAQILDLAKSADSVPEPQRADVAKAVDEVAKASSPETKKKLLSSLGALKSGLTLASDLAEPALKLFDAAQDFFS